MYSFVLVGHVCAEITGFVGGKGEGEGERGLFGANDVCAFEEGQSSVRG